MKSQGPITGSYNEGWTASPFLPCPARKGKGVEAGKEEMVCETQILKKKGGEGKPGMTSLTKRSPKDCWKLI